MKNNIDWKRIMKSLSQKCRQLGRPEIDLVKIREKLEALVESSGEYSSSRKMLQRIGSCLLEDEITIVAPVCPDYSHDAGKYTFRSLSGGVSLLAEKHIAFLKNTVNILGNTRIILLVADHEADDPALCRAVGKSREEFVDLVTSSVKSTQEAVQPYGWKTCTMTELIPDLVQREQEIAKVISSEEKFRDRIRSETWGRSEMYWKIDRSSDFEHMRVRTINTASQYVAFGTWAASKGYMVCNHTTTNLAWYLETEAAILHNPVSVY